MRAAPLACLVVVLGCGDEGPGPAPPAPPAEPWDGGPLQVADEHQFSYAATVQIDSVDLRAETSAPLRWGELTTDLLGHPVDPLTDLDLISLVAFADLTQDEVRAAIATDSLPQSEVSLFVTCEPDVPECPLGDFSLFGQDNDIERYFEEGSGTWMLTLASGEVAASAQLRKLLFLRPVAGIEEGAASVTDGSSSFTVNADLTGATGLAAPLGVAELEVDWSALTIDGLGLDLQTQRIDQLTLARFGGLTLGDVEADFLNLEQIGDGYWELALDGEATADLSAASGPDGPFPGFDGGAPWLLALRCSTCRSPMPLALVPIVPWP